MGVSSFGKRPKYLILTGVILIELICSSIYLFIPSYQREDWRGVVKFFKNQQPALILFESSGTLPPFDYYSEGQLNAKGALKDFPAKNENDVTDLTYSEGEIYLVDYLVQISDPNRLVAKKLEESGYKRIDIKNFNGVGFVYHYGKK